MFHSAWQCTKNSAKCHVDNVKRDVLRMFETMQCYGVIQFSRA